MKNTKSISLKIVIHRFLFYLFVSLGLALALGPFESSRIAEEYGEFVYLTGGGQEYAPLDQAIYQEKCKGSAATISEEHKGFVSMLRLSGLTTRERWDDFSTDLTGEVRTEFCFQQGSEVVFLVVESKGDYQQGQGAPIRVGVESLGGATTLPGLAADEETATLFPSLMYALENMRSGGGTRSYAPQYEPKDISPLEYQMVAEKIGDQAAQSITFVYRGRVYHAELRDGIKRTEETAEGLAQTKLIGGVLLIICGFFFTKGLYFSRKGIALVSNAQIGVMDFVVIAILAVLGFMAVDSTVAEYFAVDAVLGGDGLLGLFGYVPVLLILPLVVSFMSAKSVLITKQGISTNGLLMNSFMAWDEIAKLEIMEDTEFSGQRRSYNVLFFHNSDEDSIWINGNIGRRTKAEIKEQLLRLAPQPVKEMLGQYLVKL